MARQKANKYRAFHLQLPERYHKRYDKKKRIASSQMRLSLAKASMRESASSSTGSRNYLYRGRHLGEGLPQIATPVARVRRPLLSQPGTLAPAQ
jgi:hypothetical protein